MLLKRLRNLKLKRERGTSLVELMIGVAVGGIVSLAISTIFVYAVEQFNLLVEQNEAEEQLLSAAYFSKLYISQAVWTNTQTPAYFTGAPISDDAQNLVDAVNGSAVKCNRSGWDPATYSNPNTPELIAEFRREDGSWTVGTGASIFKMTAMYLQHPTGNKAGRMMIMSGILNTDLQRANAKNSGLFVDHLSKFDITCNPTGNNVPLQSVTLDISTRYFKSIDRSAWRYDAPAAISFRDVSMSVVIGLRNNVLGQSLTGDSNQSELLHGGVYYMKFSAPPPSML